MISILADVDFIGKPAGIFATNSLVVHCLNIDSHFNRWFHNIFLDSHNQPITNDALNTIDDALHSVVVEHLNRYLQNNDIESVIKLLVVVLSQSQRSDLCIHKSRLIENPSFHDFISVMNLLDLKVNIQP